MEAEQREGDGATVRKRMMTRDRYMYNSAQE